MKVKIGTFYTVCCCQDASVINDQEELEAVLEDMKYDEPPYYDFYETLGELINKTCSCDGECTELDRLTNIDKKDLWTTQHLKNYEQKRNRKSLSQEGKKWKEMSTSRALS